MRNKRAEISFDLVMEENMSFVEGTYCLPGCPWQVFIFSRRAIQQPEVRPSVWDSGVSGVVVRFPKLGVLNKETVKEILSQSLGVTNWDEVRGPDSMQLR
jgi:hypothetical protein